MGATARTPTASRLHYQFQVILKPDPGNPVELYIQSLEAIGIDPRQHDIRLVEDNWEQPAISAWGLGWEIWLDGQEITQFTYFQQVGGQSLDPVSVEITYGLDRILIALNNAAAIWDEPWNETVKYGEVRRQEEFEHSKYYFEIGDVERLRQMYDLYKAEAEACLDAGPGPPGARLRAEMFAHLQRPGLPRRHRRDRAPGLLRPDARDVPPGGRALPGTAQGTGISAAERDQRQESENRSSGTNLHYSDHLLTCCLSSGNRRRRTACGRPGLGHGAIESNVPRLLDEELHLEHGTIRVSGTPRRLAVLVERLAARQPDREDLVKGPPAERAFGPDGVPTPAAIGFAKGKGLTPKDLEVREVEGGRYVFAVVKQAGRPAAEVLVESLPGLVAGHQVRQVHALAAASRAWLSRARCAGSWRCWARRSSRSSMPV